jgi:hypothetical protein
MNDDGTARLRGCLHVPKALLSKKITKKEEEKREKSR